MKWLAKDATAKHDELIKQAKEPEVVKAVLAEIGKVGESVSGVKATYEEMRKDHNFLKKLIDDYKVEFDKLPGDIKEQIQKYTDSISTRQDSLDDNLKKLESKVASASDEMQKTIQTRLDQIELLNKPRGRGRTAEDDKLEVVDARTWKHHSLVCRFKDDEKGLTQARLDQALEGDSYVEEYREYVKAFRSFLRNMQMQKGDLSLSPEQVKALTVGADPDGGFTVTPAMATRIIQRQYEIDPMRELAAVETITTGAIEWMVDWDQAGYGWEGETEAGPETGTPGFKKVRIPVHVLYAKPRATQTLLEDSGINIENWLAGHVARRFGRAEASAFVSGDGVGKPRGFLTYPNYVTAGGASEWARIERVAMGHGTNLTADGFNLVKYALVEYYLNRGGWLMNRTAVAETMRLKDGDGQYIWRPGLEPNAPSVLLGLPVRMATSMPAVTAAALAVALADWQEAYMIVDRLGITIQRDPFTAKPFVEFYTRKRVGGDVINFEAIKLGVVST